MEKHLQGTVTVEATLDAAGNVTDARVLSGPDELRKVTLSSVLNWHFSPTAKGSTQLVQISFQTPPTLSEVVKETKIETERGERIIVTTPSPSGEPQTELTATPRNRNAAAITFLNEEVEKARERLAALESQPGADSEQVMKARLQITELERKIEIGKVMLMQNSVQEQLAENMAQLEKLRAVRENQGSTGENPELRAQIERLEGALAERRASGLSVIGRTLTAIEAAVIAWPTRKSG